MPFYCRHALSISYTRYFPGLSSPFLKNTCRRFSHDPTCCIRETAPGSSWSANLPRIHHRYSVICGRGCAHQHAGDHRTHFCRGIQQSASCTSVCPLSCTSRTTAPELRQAFNCQHRLPLQKYLPSVRIPAAVLRNTVGGQRSVSEYHEVVNDQRPFSGRRWHPAVALRLSRMGWASGFWLMMYGRYGCSGISPPALVSHCVAS